MLYKNVDIKLIIFDLDGTLTPLRSSSVAPFEQILLPGVKETCQVIREQGVHMAIATNQGGILKGFPIGSIIAHISWIKDRVGYFEYKIAYQPGYHKKPGPGMLLELIIHHQVYPRQTFFVGDSDTDRQAAENAGIGFIWADQFFGRQISFLTELESK